MVLPVVSSPQMVLAALLQRQTGMDLGLATRIGRVATHSLSTQGLATDSEEAWIAWLL